MGSVKINVGEVVGLAGQVQRAADIVSSVRADVIAARNCIDGRILSRSGLYNRLQSVSGQLSAAEGRVSRIKYTVENAANQYRQTDAQVTSWAASLGGTGFSSGKSAAFFATAVAVGSVEKAKKPEEKKDSSPLWSWSDTWKMAGTAGIIGSVVSVIGGAVTGGVSVKTGLSSAKGVAKVVENIARAIPKDSKPFDWKTLIGWNKGIPDGTTKSFGNNFEESLRKLKFGNAKTVSAKVAVAAKWAGYALTAVTTVYDNFTDTTENNSTGRKIAESVGETAVKIGEGMLIGTAVTTLLVGTGAPAVVVGVVTVGATWAIDKACEALTGGKDFAETVSDGALDFGTAAIKSVGSAAKKVSKVVSGWWGKTFG